MRRITLTGLATASLAVLALGAGVAPASAAPTSVPLQIVEDITVYNAPVVRSEAAVLALVAERPTAVVLDSTTGEVLSVDAAPGA